MDDWSSFRTTTSEQQRLRAALSGFFESQDLPEEQRAAYTAYLRKRIRSAVEMLIREDDFSKLENILQTGWLSDADRKRFLNLAADQQKWQAFRILLNRSSQDPMQENTESRKTEAAFQKEKPTKEKEALALRLFEEARKNLCWLYPELGEAILFFQHQPSDRTKAITSDGHTIYFNSDFVLRMCAENSSFLKEGYQHLLLECIRRFGKETPEPEKKRTAPGFMADAGKRKTVSGFMAGAPEFDNFMVIRGVSKFFAAPGLRFGYGLTSNQAFLQTLLTHQNPWSLNSVGAYAGERMLKDTDYIKKTWTLIDSERTRMCTELSGLDTVKIYPAYANFVLVRILKEGLTSFDVFEKAIHQDLMIRDCSSFESLNGEYVRFCIMNPEDNDRLLDVFRSL